MMKKWEIQERGGSRRARAREARRNVSAGVQGSSEDVRLLSRVDMVRYLDDRDGWNLAEGECCFNRAVGYRAQRVLGMLNLGNFRHHVRKKLPCSIRPAPLKQQRWVKFEVSTNAQLLVDGRSVDMPPRMQLEHMWETAPMWCAEAMLVEWMAEPRVGVLMDLVRIRSRLPAILGAAADAATDAAQDASDAMWSCCWRCSSCWAAYRRAVSVATVLVLVASSPRIVTLWKAHLDSHFPAYPALVAELGAGRQVEKDCFASLLVQILGVKGTAELTESFGFYAQNLLSGGLEKAHAERIGGLEGVGGGDTDLVGSEWANGFANNSRRIGKVGKWRENLKGPVWERYVDGMAWILKNRGAEGAGVRCSHGSEGSSSGGGSSSSGRKSSRSGGGRGSNSHGNSYASGNGAVGEDAPKGMCVSGVDATEFALAAATVYSSPQYWTGAQVLLLDANNFNKTRVDDAAIEEARRRLAGVRREGGSRGGGKDAAIAEARERLRSTRLTREMHGGGVGDGRSAAAAAAASPTATESLASAATSAGASGSTDISASGCLSAELVPVNSNSMVAALTHRAACVLTWVRTYGSDSILEKHCCQNSPPGKALPMRHPLRDLPNLLVRFGAIPKPMEGSSFSLEWEEWPEGDETAVKFPTDPRERCFELGIVNERGAAEKGGQKPSEQALKAGESRGIGGGRDAGVVGKAVGRGGGRNRGHARGDTSRRALLIPSPPTRSDFPIVRCKADVDFLVGFAGRSMKPPACTKCFSCFNMYTTKIPFLALIANYAYRPVSVLFNRFVSHFPLHSPEYNRLIDCMFNPREVPRPVSVSVMRERAKQMPILFLINVALWWGKQLLGVVAELLTNKAEGKGVQAAARGECAGEAGRKGGKGKGPEGWDSGQDEDEEDGEVWEEVRMWYIGASVAWPAALRPDGMIEKCSGHEEQGTTKNVTWILEKAAVPRFCEELQSHYAPCSGSANSSNGGSSSASNSNGGSGSASSSSDGISGSSKKEEVPAYLKPWPGGVNLVACLREMLLGQPCYRPPSRAASSTPAAGNTTVATTGFAASASAAAAASAAATAGAAATASAAPSAAAPSIGVPFSTAGAATLDTAAAANSKGVVLAPCTMRMCGAEGCGGAEGGGVKLKSCAGCGKVAYCSRDCQKAQWPSHKLTCPGRTGKKSGKDGRGDGGGTSGLEGSSHRAMDGTGESGKDGVRDTGRDRFLGSEE
ncbi:hypothetical protein CLOM_g14865 [Closterium sp. NIES-68]|nr:hypothetical protein CLOM_g14865 [Closterium sp. NIES-68]GJP62015.1 hypothetical protein CLOP_g19120 [Closterium sp. NIES-67]